MPLGLGEEGGNRACDGGLGLFQVVLLQVTVLSDVPVPYPVEASCESRAKK